MPTWPTNKPDSNRFNSDSDSIKQSRTELKTMSDAVNDIVDFIDTTGIGAGKVLVYNASTSRLEVGENLLNISAGTNITIDNDSAGGITINAGGGLSNPLTENLETERFLIGRIAPDSASGNNPTAIQFTDTNAINLISTQSYFPDSAGDQVFLDSGTVTLQNYIKGRVSSSTGNPIPTFDHAGIKLFSAGTLDSAGDDETSQIGLTAGGRGVFITHGDATIGGGNGGQNIYLDNTRGLLLNNTIPNVDSAGEDPSSITLQTSAGNVRLEPNNTIYLKYALWPTTDGSSGQVLQTNGSGQLSWATVSGGGDEVAAGNNINISQPDSTGTKSISFRSPFNQPVDAGDQQLSNLSIKNYGEIVYTSGSTSGTITPDPNNGSVQKITLTGSITLNSLSNVASGDSLTLIVKQPSSGGPYTLSSTMKFSGANKTLSTGANEIDIITIFYDGTDYLASLSTNFS
tara:strand:+ start:4766 stop:6142 length:1377 start_codon:yes stop_codon:yes gene_type:complete